MQNLIKIISFITFAMNKHFFTLKLTINIVYSFVSRQTFFYFSKKIKKRKQKRKIENYLPNTKTRKK